MRRRTKPEATKPAEPMDREALARLANSTEPLVSVRSIDVAELAAEHPENRTFAALAKSFANAAPDRRQQVAPETLRELLGIEPKPRAASA